MRPKPLKRDYANVLDFLRASSAWAEARTKQWPWDSSPDEDDEFFYVLTDSGWFEVMTGRRADGRV